MICDLEDLSTRDRHRALFVRWCLELAHLTCAHLERIALTERWSLELALACAPLGLVATEARRATDPRLIAQLHARTGRAARLELTRRAALWGPR